MTVFSDKEALWRRFSLRIGLNALQIRPILEKRASKAFKKNALEDGVIQKCSALATKCFEGRTDRAITLLQFAGERADYYKRIIVRIGDLDWAYYQLWNIKTLLEAVKKLSKGKKRIEKVKGNHLIIHHTAPIKKVEKAIKDKIHNKFSDVFDAAFREGDFYINGDRINITYLEPVKRSKK